MTVNLFWKLWGAECGIYNKGFQTILQEKTRISAQCPLCVGKPQRKTHLTCGYEGGNTHIIQVEKINVNLYEISSGKVIAEKTFHGNPPPKSCPSNQEFPSGCRGCRQYETNTPEDNYKTEIINWVAKYLRKPLF